MPRVDKSCGGGKPGAETREKWNSLGSTQEEASAWAGLIGQLNDWFITCFVFDTGWEVI